MLLMVEKPLRITLELEPGAEPIAGRLYADDRPQHSFHGWLEFAAAIERACEEGGAGHVKRSSPARPEGSDADKL